VKRLSILGCSGSIGRQTLDVVGWHPEEFRVAVLAARSDSPSFRELVWRFRPSLAVAVDGSEAGWQPPETRLRFGEEALIEAAETDAADLVVVATAGRAGLRPTLAALRAGKPVALANKEALVAAGHLVMRAAETPGAAILPVDSEHSGVWQCLLGEAGPGRIRAVTLTASGGALRDMPLVELAEVTPEQALRHPNWQMGPKITIDSATLMNKGLEVLEAACLFRLDLDQVRVVVHRESIVHALVEFTDGSVKAQLACPDMRVPILYALAYPRRLPSPLPSLDLARLGRLSFAPVEWERYPCLELAYSAGRRSGTYPTVLNAANEEATYLFLSGAARFGDIPNLVREALERHIPTRDPDLDGVLQADGWARAFTLEHALVRAR
jgi:1-deoxy-D-xylulose-5-phosphate reductoisomerase